MNKFVSFPQLEKCSQELGTSTKAVSSAIAQLLSEATQGNENYTGGINTNTHRQEQQKMKFHLSLYILRCSQYIKMCFSTQKKPILIYESSLQTTATKVSGIKIAFFVNNNKIHC